ncbi:MAG: GNAT family N-acetyltransferase [Candidatus Pacebacteria bacterium]|nr:GNAT family N-acetyltransferase [Candidatus Paceibacterota bacterium]
MFANDKEKPPFPETAPESKPSRDKAADKERSEVELTQKQSAESAGSKPPDIAGVREKIARYFPDKDKSAKVDAIKREITSLADEITGKKEFENKVKEMSRVLVKAFEDDISTKFITNGNEKVAGRIFEFLIKMAADNGKVYSVKNERGDVQAVAVWVAPPSYGEILTHGFVPLMRTLVEEPKSLKNFLSCLSFCSGIEEKLAPRDHLSLSYIGTDPALQGSGLGTSLLKESLKRIDEDKGKPCYLELLGTKEELGNLSSFYSKFGFEEASQTVCYKEKEGIYHKAMVRPGFSGSSEKG